MRTLPRFACAATCAGLLVASGDAQTITRVIPEAAAPGDLIIIVGTGLGSTTSVSFTADTGGFVGPWTLPSPALSVTNTRVTTTVPGGGTWGFVGPNATPPSTPLGTVVANTSLGDSNSLPFFFMQGTFFQGNTTPQTTTLGTGRTQSNGMGKPVVSFDLSGGPPVAGNTNFVMEVENAVPNVLAVMLIGFPGSLPFPMLGDGTFTLNPGLPIVVAGLVTTDAQGDAQFPLAIPGPGPFNVTLAIQWVILDPVFVVAVSNGLQAIL